MYKRQQQGDFEKLYEAMEGKSVTIRFLDPPLHEFVPTEEKDIELLAKTQGKTCLVYTSLNFHFFVDCVKNSFKIGTGIDKLIINITDALDRPPETVCCY